VAEVNRSTEESPYNNMWWACHAKCDTRSKLHRKISGHLSVEGSLVPSSSSFLQ